MAIADKERDHLISYIEHRKCEEARQGRDCIDRKGKGDLVGGRHPACREADEMIDIVRRA